MIFETLIYYIQERDLIRQAKVSSSDDILLKYRFCNNERIYDRGTKYWISKLKGVTDLHEIVFNTAMYRFFNKTSTFDIIGWNTNHDKLNLLNSISGSVFTDAWQLVGYMTLPGSNMIEKSHSFLDELLSKTDLIVSELKKGNQKAFSNLKGVGNFIGYQMLLDVESIFNIKCVPVCGTGSESALKLLDLTFDEAYAKFHANTKLTLSHTDFEHTLCEFLKYWKIKHEPVFKIRLRKQRTVSLF